MSNTTSRKLLSALQDESMPIEMLGEEPDYRPLRHEYWACVALGWVAGVLSALVFVGLWSLV